MSDLDIELWTDGSGIATGGVPIGWGWVLLAKRDGEIVANRCGGGCGHEGTNNRAELMAVLEGLRTLTKPTVLTVVTDSEYVANQFTDGNLDWWAENADEDGLWRLRSKGHKPVKNQDIWKLLHKEAERHVLTFKTIPGHAGHEWNERCDRIAGTMRKALVAELAEPDQGDADE